MPTAVPWRYTRTYACAWVRPDELSELEGETCIQSEASEKPPMSKVSYISPQNSSTLHLCQKALTSTTHCSLSMLADANFARSRVLSSQPSRSHCPYSSWKPPSCHFPYGMHVSRMPNDPKAASEKKPGSNTAAGSARYCSENEG